MSELRDSGQRDGTGLSARRFRVVAEWPSVEASDEQDAIDACERSYALGDYDTPLWSVAELPTEKGDETA